MNDYIRLHFRCEFIAFWRMNDNKPLVTDGKNYYYFFLFWQNLLHRSVQIVRRESKFTRWKLWYFLLLIFTVLRWYNKRTITSAINYFRRILYTHTVVLVWMRVFWRCWNDFESSFIQYGRILQTFRIHRFHIVRSFIRIRNSFYF